MFDLGLALRFGAALGLGLLLGLERERKRDAEMLFGGVRTFALIALLGAIAPSWNMRWTRAGCWSPPLSLSALWLLSLTLRRRRTASSASRRKSALCSRSSSGRYAAGTESEWRAPRRWFASCS